MWQGWKVHAISPSAHSCPFILASGFILALPDPFSDPSHFASLMNNASTGARQAAKLAPVLRRPLVLHSSFPAGR